MRLEQTIRETISESVDLDARLQQLVRAGLMPQNTLPLLRKAIAKVQAGMPLQGAERDVMGMFINSMMYIVLGDDTIFNKARAGAKSYAAEEVELDESAKVAAHLIKRYGDNVRKSHVRSAANDFGVGYVALSHAVRKKLGVNRLEEKSEDDLPFDGPYRKVGERKDKYGNVVKNVAKHLAKKAMKNEETELEEGWGVKVNAFSKWKEGVQDWADNHTHNGKVDIQTKKVGAGGKEWHQTIASHKGVRVGHFNHDGTNKSEKGHGTHAHFSDNIHEEVTELEELSRATVGRYAQKAKSIADNEGGKDRTKGRELAGRKRWGGTMSGVKKAKVMATEDVEQIDERDEGKPGKMFAKIAAKAAKKYGSKEAGNRVAGAIRKKVLAKEDIEAVKQMNESYRDTFNAALEQYGVKSPSELDEEKRKQFFNFVDQNYKKGDN